jgi:hypothetical protein
VLLFLNNSPQRAALLRPLPFPGFGFCFAKTHGRITAGIRAGRFDFAGFALCETPAAKNRIRRR